ncbi:uncharacterized protein LOC120340596 [Styela clava]
MDHCQQSYNAPPRHQTRQYNSQDRRPSETRGFDGGNMRNSRNTFSSNNYNWSGIVMWLRIQRKRRQRKLKRIRTRPDMAGQYILQSGTVRRQCARSKKPKCKGR